MLVDTHNRRLNYLRLSITDKCNLNCVYCDPGRGTPKLYYKEILRYEELLRIVRIGVRLGIDKVRVTGGEPLVRKGVIDFLYQLCGIKGLRDVSLTTNGILFCRYADRILDAGIKRVNISLDTLDRKKFLEITGSDRFDSVIMAVFKALDLGFSPVKINMVPISGINDDEIEAFARLTIKYPLSVRFIEYMPMGPCLEKRKPLLAPEIKRRLEGIGELEPLNLKRSSLDGPAERYRIRAARGEIGLIRPISAHFCSTCNRLRLTASGKIRTCLLSDRQHDLKPLLRSGALDDEISSFLISAVREKPASHNLSRYDKVGVPMHMRSIGG